MKIQSVEPLELGDVSPEGGISHGSPWSSTIILVKVTTSSGAVGWGESPTTLMTLPVLESIKEVARHYLGRDTHEAQRCFHDFYRASFYQSVSMEATSALSGVDIAVHDLLGHELGAPVADLMGGRVRDMARAYANGWYSDCVEPDTWAAKAKSTVARGLTALKFDPFGDQFDPLTSEGLARAVARVRAVREAVGDGVDLLIEHHGRFQLADAIRAGLALEPLNPFFNEEPVHPELAPRLAEYKAHVKTPVALGERVLTPAGFVDALRRGCVDILQPDITNSGGFTSGRAIAGIAEGFGAGVAYHNAFGPVQTAATLQMDAWMPAFVIQESFEPNWPDWKLALTSGYTLERGAFTIPRGPGLGITINEKVLEAQRVEGMEPLPAEPPWVIGGTWRPGGTAPSTRPKRS